MHATDKRTHVRGGAGARNEDEIPMQTLGAQAVRPKEIRRPFNNCFACEHGDVHTSEKTDGSGLAVVNRNADGPSARDSRESFRDSRIERAELYS